MPSTIIEFWRLVNLCANIGVICIIDFLECSKTEISQLDIDFILLFVVIGN